MAGSAAAASVAPAPKRPKKNVLLFYCEEMRELAERVMLESDYIELRSISWRKIPSVAPAPKRPKKNVLLFYCEEMRELAERVVLESDSIELRSISWRFTLPRRRKLNDQVCTGAKKSEELSKLAARKLSNSFNLNTKGTQMRRLVRFPWHV